MKAEAPEAVRVLLEGGAEWRGSGTVQVSAMKGRLGYLRVLVEKGVDVEDFNGRVEGRKRAVVLAREKGEVEIVEFLKERRAVE